jgi:hypothetical protein
MAAGAAGQQSDIAIYRSVTGVERDLRAKRRGPEPRSGRQTGKKGRWTRRGMGQIRLHIRRLIGPAILLLNPKYGCPGERARCRRTFQPLRRQDIQHHRRGRFVERSVGRGAPIGAGHRIVGKGRRGLKLWISLQNRGRTLRPP